MIVIMNNTYCFYYREYRTAADDDNLNNYYHVCQLTDVEKKMISLRDYIDHKY